ncbi:hypothetical protein OOZ63_08780 [Paucibacter sp. PLA-PC-4]|uniref:hypothetical protein n=1 Tax=Paucibacter sp. PLA-PC-4 TaxID=2993655 RepID=UPI0022489681|nr:hypothetical protein [Paucibacter sp. PLA-PC-4]MCX2861932.1 hypothetical protein [Paucibacter sp. PLA-PC-4]
MNLPNPAIVAERGAQRLPRLALLLFCAAYVIPGLFGRDPWRNADMTAFGFMASIAQGHAPWWQPAIAGIPAEGGLLPYWLGAAFIKALPFLDPALAARLPFGLALVAVLVLVWYTSFHLARTDAAQPVAFAFGGEAHAIDYARALADGALLALVASLGLLLLGHETTPELMQLLACSLFIYGLAAAPYRETKARVAVLLALPLLAASGAPAMAAALGAGGAWLVRRSSYEQVRRLLPWLLVAVALGALSAWEFRGWAWRVAVDSHAKDPLRFISQLAWFCWPAWPMALWTLWRWRRHWQHRHVSVPLLGVLVPLITSLLMNGSDRALLLALPALAVLASFALPTLRRSVAAAMDWFSVFFFSAGALFVWAYYASMQAGWPTQPLVNIRKLAQGFEPSFHPLALAVALIGTAAWIALVRWRTARHQHALWKSLVLPAGGVALLWLLAMSLWLPLLDYARSNRALIERLRSQLPAELNCLAAPGQPMSLLASLEFQGGWVIEARQPLAQTRCQYALLQNDTQATPELPEGWGLVGKVRRPTDRVQHYLVLRRL